MTGSIRVAVVIAAFASIVGDRCMSAIVDAPQRLSGDSAATLRAEIARADSLRVIVTLQVGAVKDRSDAIPIVQKQVLEALEGTSHTVVLVFRSAPIITLVVGRDALEVLLSHPAVTSITIDRERAPSDSAK
jgi:hypothetical protein